MSRHRTDRKIYRDHDRRRVKIKIKQENLAENAKGKLLTPGSERKRRESRAVGIP